MIDKDKELMPGDIIEMHFKTLGLGVVTATQIAIIEWQFNKRKDYNILNWRNPPGTNRIIFTIIILEPPKIDPDEIQIYKASAVSTAAIIGAIVIAASILPWLTMTKVYQLYEKAVESPAGKVAIAGFGGLAAAAAIVLVVGLLGGSK